jgi:hypothetical protein
VTRRRLTIAAVLMVIAGVVAFLLRGTGKRPTSEGGELIRPD